jgi:uncharacterized protein YcnI
MIRSTMRAASTVTVGLMVPLLAVPAYAHVTANPDEAGSPYFRTALRVSHGCEGSATTAVRVQVPEHVGSMRPEVVPGWEIDIVEDDGVATEVGWHGGHLPDEHFQEFGLSLYIEEDAPEVLWLPTIQECEEGEHRWIEIPQSIDEWNALDEPAPYVQVAFGAHADGGDTTATSADEPDEEVDEEQSDHSTEDTEQDDETAAAASDDGSAAMPLAVAGLIAGILGLLAGVTALLRGRSRSSS